MDATTLALKSDLDRYLDVYGFKTCDFFGEKDLGVAPALQTCLGFAKQHLLTNEQLKDPGIGLERIHQFQKQFPQFIFLLTHTATAKIKYDIASRILSLASSFHRPQLLINMYGRVGGFDWEKLFANHWSSCDGCTAYASCFIEILGTANLSEIRKNVSKEDMEAYNALPDMVTIYRGTIDCNDINTGISWTLDEKVATKFAQISHNIVKKNGAALRYILGMGSDYEQIMDCNSVGGVVIKATVPKEKIIYMNARDESEVIINFHMDLDDFSVFKTIDDE